eukprot:scaffold105123_cov49-Phaeocystis_antarctica.AAC.1
MPRCVQYNIPPHIAFILNISNYLTRLASFTLARRSERHLTARAPTLHAVTASRAAPSSACRARQARRRRRRPSGPRASLAPAAAPWQGRHAVRVRVRVRVRV